MKLNIFAVIAILLSSVLLTACEHTVAGMGQDMQNTGAAIERSAKNS